MVVVILQGTRRMKTSALQSIGQLTLFRTRFMVGKFALFLILLVLDFIDEN